MQIEQKQNRIYRPQGVYTLSAEESNQITTELENLIAEGGLTPNANVLTQVKDSVNAIVDAAANNLQTQIDAITSASNVFDIVGTYAQLQAYDTADVSVDDIIKVLQDSTHQNAASYYRWSGTAWVYVGQEGPYYTKSEIDTDFALKSEIPGLATVAQAGIVKPDNQTIMVGNDGTISATTSILAALPLFTCQFSDHLINNPSYLRADTFSWHSGTVYTSGYQHLVDDIAGKTAQTETISGTTITFYRADDGHKIVLAAQESNVTAIYNATGVAWYYILDTANTRFKLPRTKYAFAGLRDTVGNYVAPGLPNHTHSPLYVQGSTDDTGDQGQYVITDPGVFWGTATNQGSTGGVVETGIYGNSTTVQPPATQMYLYFYVGNTVQDQTTIDIGEITEALNDKADTDLGNVSVPYVTESYTSGTSWYRKWSDGRIEQGGHVSDDTQALTIVLLTPFTSTNYQVFSNCTVTNAAAATGRNYVAYNKTTTQFSCAEGYSNSSALAYFWDGGNDWLAVGY